MKIEKHGNEQKPTHNRFICVPIGALHTSKENQNKFSDLSHPDKEYAHNIFLELINESGNVIFEGTFRQITANGAFGPYDG